MATLIRSAETGAAASHWEISRQRPFAMQLRLAYVGFYSEKRLAARRPHRSDPSGGMTGQRIIAARWDPALPPGEAAAAAARPIGWPELTSDVVWPSD